jgi:hypothetical protein
VKINQAGGKSGWLSVTDYKKKCYIANSGRLRISGFLGKPKVAIQGGGGGVQNQTAIGAVLEMVFNLSLHTWREFSL